MKLHTTLTILMFAAGSISFAASTHVNPSNSSIIEAQWTDALKHQSAHTNSSQVQKIGVFFTIDDKNKVKILNMAGADKAMYDHFKNQLDGLDNITELQPNEVYRIDISFQVV